MGIGQLILLVIYLFGWFATIKTIIGDWEWDDFSALFVFIHFVAVGVCGVLVICALWDTPIF